MEREHSPGAGGAQPARARARLTKRLLDSLPKTGPAIVWDGELPGFGVRYQGGAWRYVLKYRVRGRQRWIAIGRHGAPWTVETARDEARRLLGLVAADMDPATQRDAGKACPTLREFAERYVVEFAEVHKKPRTVVEERGLLGLRLAPRSPRRPQQGRHQRTVLDALGRLRLDEITHADVVRFHTEWKDTPTRANRALTLLAHMFGTAERWGLRLPSGNPCRGLRRYPERRHERFLSEAEFARLGDALDEAERDGSVSPVAAAAVRLLIFTGCRMSEALTLRWEHVHLDAGALRLPDSKTGAKAVYLNPPALKLLASLPRFEGNPHVFPGLKPGAPLTDLEHPWQRVRARAGLDDVRLHDLRHSFASVAASRGHSLLIAGKLLGHTQAATTQRYAHLSADPVRAASDDVAATIEAAMRKTTERRDNVHALRHTKISQA